MAWERERQFTTDLLDKRVIYPIDGEVNAELAENIGKAIVLLNAQSEVEPITIYIDSMGGSAKSGLDIYYALKASKAPVTGIVFRSAESMATVILQACTLRKAYRSATLLAHALWMKISLPEYEDEESGFVEDVYADQALVEQILAERSGKTPREIHKYMWANRNEERMSAEEALKFGLIDGIIP